MKNINIKNDSTFTFKLSKELLEIARQQAAKNNISLAAYVKLAITEKINKEIN